MIHWKTLILSWTKLLTVFMSGSLIRLLSRFAQIIGSFENETGDYEWAIESFTSLIHLKTATVCVAWKVFFVVFGGGAKTKETGNIVSKI